MKEENKIVVFQLSALNCWEKPILVTCCTRQGVDDDDVMIKSGMCGDLWESYVRSFNEKCSLSNCN